ncbi:hypothetical protein HYC85_006963 [Camellia sinensis]|uniref:ATP synthase subunit d, mitochondrial n=1 Tax=Camellia sinensis TaxID=4442 RepID=A0A7J7HNU6_CAMSI|nr:hypothetical protein HYC85_006963 [Camellia sinensis]
MSGSRAKKVVDVAFKAGKSIDWDGMAKLLVSDEARKEFVNLRRAFDEVNSTLQTKFSQEPEPIDWEHYRKGIGSRLVDMYKEAYESIYFLFGKRVIRWTLDVGGFFAAYNFKLGSIGVSTNLQPSKPVSPRRSRTYFLWLTNIPSLDLVCHGSSNTFRLYGKDCCKNCTSPVAYHQTWAGIEIPKYVDNVTPQYKPKFEALLVELKEAEKKSLKESERLEKEIAEVQELKNKISTMTAEEYFSKHPEVKKKFDDEIRNDYWGY